jgi:site-specific recombinase XerD
MKRRIESYLQYLQLANRSENTIRSYRGYLLDFARFAEVLDVENIERYLAVLHQREFAKASTRRALATLKSFGRWMVDEGLLRENPVEAFRGPRGSRRIKERISEGEAGNCAKRPAGRAFRSAIAC